MYLIGMQYYESDFNLLKHTIFLTEEITGEKEYHKGIERVLKQFVEVIHLDETEKPNDCKEAYMVTHANGFKYMLGFKIVSYEN